MDLITLATLRDAHAAALESLGSEYEPTMAQARAYFEHISADAEVQNHLRNSTRLEAVRAGIYVAASSAEHLSADHPAHPAMGAKLAGLMAGGYRWIEDRP
jgi:hypothetical protein